MTLALVFSGLSIGLMLGLVLSWSNFCVMGAISDAVGFGSWTRMRAWLLAVAVAIAGTQLLALSGVTDLSQSSYLRQSRDLLTPAVGGLIFGVGMVLAGGCISRNVVRAGSGDLGAVLNLAIVAALAWATLFGPIEPLRSTIATSLADAWSKLPHAGAFPKPVETPGHALSYAAIAAVALAAVFLVRSDPHRAGAAVGSGIGVGAAVVTAWALTSLLLDPLATQPMRAEGLTYVRPTADLAGLIGGSTSPSPSPFGLAVLFGTLAGATLGAGRRGVFRLTGLTSAAATARGAIGASMMGFGGVLAGGCTIGQGVTGLSTLAIGSFAAVFGILLGGVIAVKGMERWS